METINQPSAVPPAVPQAPSAAPVSASSQTTETSGKQKKGLLAFLLVLLIAISLLFLANKVVPRILTYLTRATNSPGNFSLANSYVFGSPLLAQANGEDKIRVTAFLLDDKGRGVPNSQISLSVRSKDSAGSALPEIFEVSPLTDDFGRAVFEITSAVPGQFTVSALINGTEFPQTVTLTFN